MDLQFMIQKKFNEKRTGLFSDIFHLLFQSPVQAWRESVLDCKQSPSLFFMTEGIFHIPAQSFQKRTLRVLAVSTTVAEIRHKRKCNLI